MENNDKVYKNLITILKLFQNRPYHLAKYLMESNALTEDFMNKIENSEKLESLNKDNDNFSIKAIYFIDISHMNDFFNSLTDDEFEKKLNNKRDVAEDLNKKLDNFLAQEKYEEAIRIRDYMQKNGIERKKD